MANPEKSLFSSEGEALCQVLREERKRRRLSQAEVAATYGWSQSVIAKIEQGERRLDVVEFLWLVRAMGADPIKILALVTKRSRGKQTQPKSKT